MCHIYFLCWNPIIDCQHWISSIFINLEGLLVILVKQNRPDLVYLKSFTFNISHSQAELNTVFSSLSMNSTWIQCFKFIIKISLWVFLPYVWSFKLIGNVCIFFFYFSQYLMGINSPCWKMVKNQNRKSDGKK